MPEERKAQQTSHDGRAKTFDGNLRHHHHQPNQTCRDMEPMTSDKGEERREKSTALRRRSDGYHVGELADFESEERGPERESDEQQRDTWRLRRRELIESDIIPQV